MINAGFIDRRLFRHFDWILLLLCIAIPVCGLIVLYSAGYDPDTSLTGGILPFAIKSQPFFKQGIFFAIGFVVLLIAMSISPQLLYRYAYFFYGACIALLIAVIFFGSVINGSRRWIPLASGFNIQPAEIMKLGIILCMSRYLTRNPPRGKPYNLKQLLMPAFLILFPMALIMKQPDLGSAVAVGAIGGIMVLFMGVRPRIIIVALLLVAGIAPLAWHKLHGYQQRRILTLFDPEADPRGSGYHIMQSIIAVGSGEIGGKGFMRGTQTQLEFLPEHTTDFIFSVLAEEWGFFGCAFVLVLYLALMYRLLRISGRSKELFSSLVAFGVATFFAVHTTINVGMVIGILPVVGIPLPLFSYGGSAVLTLMFGLGLVLGISMRRLAFLHGRS